MILNKFVSRFETPRVQISREAYENFGIEIFSTEKIPFANRTDPEFAENLTELLIARIKNLQKLGRSFPDGIHIYELGAGTGILAKRILNLLKSEHKNIYKLIVLHLSDFSKPMISQLKSSGVFKNHKGHITFEVIDATKPKFTHKPLLVYFTNLIDAISYQRQILIKDGQIFEFLIQTSLKKDAQIIDTTSYPPKILEEKDIYQLILSPNSKRRLILTPQILPLLEERFEIVPIADILNISNEEKEDLKKLVESRGKYQPLVFNYSYHVRTMIKKIIQELEEGGFIFFSDFGIILGRSEKRLYLEFGLVMAFSVDFPTIVQVAEMAEKVYYLTSNPPGYPQEMLIDSFGNDTQMESLFKKESVGDLQERVTSFLEIVKTILFKSSEGQEQKSEKINKLYHSLAKKVKNDYLLINNLALFLLQANFFQDAALYVNLLLEKYGHTVGIYYYLIKGKAAQEKGKLEEAEKFFKKAADQKSFLANAYLGELYWQQKRYLDYIKTIKNYLKDTRRGDYLRSMVSIAAAQEKLLRHKAAKKTLKDLINIGRKLKTLSEAEKESLKQAESALAL
ncbi:SAM-dependent methyltransferase [Candidatus Roizmanbacteria bacterium]|nr:SAM-dependent methyltransferase [Candidatus Roizmanbacteria bacterium]